MTHYPRVATDICVFRERAEGLELLLIQRSKAPYKDCWALPGGRLEANESLDECASRELMEETGIRSAWIRQLCNFSDPDRDPRERTISAAYIAMVDDAEQFLRPGSDAKNAGWFLITALPEMAFDHDRIVAQAVESFGSAQTSSHSP